MFCNRNNSAFKYVGSSGNYLYILVFSDVYLANNQLVCVRMFFNFVYFPNNNVLKLCTGVFNALNYRTAHG